MVFSHSTKSVLSGAPSRFSLLRAILLAGDCVGHPPLGYSSLSMNYDGKSSVIWNGSWGAVDKNITNFVTRFHDKQGNQTHPETQPHNPWPN